MNIYFVKGNASGYTSLNSIAKKTSTVLKKTANTIMKISPISKERRRLFNGLITEKF